MIDFNDPYLTNQQKQSILCSIAQGHNLERTTKENLAKARTSFASHWILTMRDLKHLNQKGAEKLDKRFAIPQSILQQHHPDFSVIIFESDRIEKGEWDNMFCRWESVGYQNTLVIGCLGKVKSACSEGVIYDDEYSLPEIKTLSNFPLTVELMRSETRHFPIGLLDFPLHDLQKYEENRHFERISADALDWVHNECMHVAVTGVSSKHWANQLGREKRHRPKGFGN